MNLSHTVPLNPVSLNSSTDRPSNLLQAPPSFLVRQKLYETRGTLMQRQFATKELASTSIDWKAAKQSVIHEPSTAKRAVLYKRLSNIQNEAAELDGMSFSKLLSKMVVVEEPSAKLPEPMLNTQSYFRSYRCVKSRLYSIECPETSTQLKSVPAPSDRLFKKYYMPRSDMTKPEFRVTVHVDDKYIYRNGKKAQCKRIHNFYTSKNFQKGFDKYLKETTSSFHSDRYRSIET